MEHFKPYDQDYFNNLHALFVEKSRGISNQRLELMNRVIHDLEALEKNISLGDSYESSGVAGIIFHFENEKNFLMSKSLESCFTLDYKFGDIFLGYATEGKSWWQSFIDQSTEDLAPYCKLTSAFDLYMGYHSPSKEERSAFREFVKENSQKCKIKFGGEGFGVLARLDTSMNKISNSELLLAVGEVANIKSLIVSCDEKELCKSTNIIAL